MKDLHDPIKEAFKSFCYFFDWSKVEGKYKKVGTWRLVNNSAYGGYVIEEIINEKGEVIYPFGKKGQGALEFIRSIEKMKQAIEVYREEQKKWKKFERKKQLRSLGIMALVLIILSAIIVDKSFDFGWVFCIIMLFAVRELYYID